MIKDTLRRWTPKFLLDWNRRRKKKRTRLELSLQKSRGQLISKKTLIEELMRLGLKSGDTVLVHSSMSKIGYLEEGPKTFVDAFLSVIGDQGNLMMPSSPNASLQLDYIKTNPVFDVKNSPSKLGAITEYFRSLKGVKRSLNCTEPVCAIGPDAHYLTSGHFNEITPYTVNSPFRRLYEKKGKILYVGVTLDNAGTNLHTLEDHIPFPYPVYYDEIFNASIIDEQGVSHQVKTKVHNPVWSSKRKCDQLLPMFKSENVYLDGKLGNANTLLFDGQLMFDVMLKAFKERGVTMYHPQGI